jgi:hypothetical protein
MFYVFVLVLTVEVYLENSIIWRSNLFLLLIYEKCFIISPLEKYSWWLMAIRGMPKEMWKSTNIDDHDV